MKGKYKRKKNRLQQRKRNGEVLQYRSFGARAATINEDERTIQAVIATDTPVPMYDWEQGRVIPEILLMSGGQIPDSRQVPMLDSHNRFESDDVKGSVRELEFIDNELVGRAHFSSLADREWTKVREGHITDFSAGYRVVKKEFVDKGESTTIGDRTFDGPVNVVTEWRLREASITPIGADEQAKMRGVQIPRDAQVEEFEMDKELRAFLVSLGMDEKLSDEEAQKWAVRNLPNNSASTGTATGDEGVGDTPNGVVSLEDFQAVKKRLDDTEALVRRTQLVSEVRSNCEAVHLSSDRTAEIIASVEKGDIASLDAARSKIFEILADGGVEIGNATVTTGVQSLDQIERSIDSMMQVRYLRNLYRDPAVFDREYPAEKRLKESEWEEFRFMTGVELAEFCLQREGVNTRGIPKSFIVQSALSNRFLEIHSNRFPQLRRALETRADPGYHTSGMFTFLTGSQLNRSLQAGYTEVNTTWQTIVIPGMSRPDFRDYTLVSLSETPYLEEWTDNDAPNQVSMTDIGETNAVRARSVGISFSFQTMVNDDLGGFSRAQAELGASAARTLNAHVWARITNGTTETLQDGVALFSAVSGNRLKSNHITSGSGVPTQARLAAMRELMRLQVGLNDRENAASRMHLNIEPGIVAVPVELEEEATVLINSPSTESQANPNRFNTARVYELVVEPLLSDNDTSAYYMFARPQERPWADLAFLEGYETPQIRQQEDFDTLSMKAYVTHIYQCKAIDFRPVVKDDGVA